MVAAGAVGVGPGHPVLLDRAVTVGALNAHEAVVTSGLDEGAVIQRNTLNRVAR